jgi:hypothetical protein
LLKEIAMAARVDDVPLSFLPANLVQLKNVMTATHENENQFNGVLFAILRDCLKEYELESNHSDFFLIKNNQDPNANYAVGFACRETRGSLDLFPPHEPNVTATDDSTSSSELGSHQPNRQNHLVCLFHRRDAGGAWEPTDCFAIVELKSNNTNCFEFSRNSATHQIIVPSETASIQHPLAQVILCTLDCVLLYHARRGKLVHELPLAIVACKEQDKKAPSLKAKHQRVEQKMDSKYVDIKHENAVAGDDDAEDSCLQEIENRKPAKFDHPLDDADGDMLAQVLDGNKSSLKRSENSGAASSQAGNDEQLHTKKPRKVEQVRCLIGQFHAPNACVANQEMDKKDMENKLREEEDEESEEEEDEEDVEQTTLKRVRWVSGQLHVPEANGNRFYFSVNDFGHFDESDSVEKALSLYLNTMCLGLKVAIQVRDELVVAGGGALSPAVPASGHQLMVGETHLKQMEFCASPIRGANPTKCGEIYSIGQGELFKGKLNVFSTLQQARRKLVFLSSSVSKTAELDVLIKVSSTTVHSILVNPQNAFGALKDIRYSEEPEQVPDDVLIEIGSVLYGAVKTDVGIITIMADLSVEHYKALQPKDYENDLLTLWNAFIELVRNVLLPLAKSVGVIHPDIRPGYDLTANILLKDDSNGKKTMKLIDYESFVLFRDWVAPNAARYMSKQDGKDAITFVWWQCVAMAYFWASKTSIRPVRGKKSKLTILRGILLYKKGGPIWLKALRGMASGKVTAAEVESTLDQLAKVFQKSETVDNVIMD